MAVGTVTMEECSGWLLNDSCLHWIGVVFLWILAVVLILLWVWLYWYCCCHQRKKKGSYTAVPGVPNCVQTEPPEPKQTTPIIVTEYREPESVEGVDAEVQHDTTPECATCNITADTMSMECQTDDVLDTNQTQTDDCFEENVVAYCEHEAEEKDMTAVATQTDFKEPEEPRRKVRTPSLSPSPPPTPPRARTPSPSPPPSPPARRQSYDAPPKRKTFSRKKVKAPPPGWRIHKKVVIH